MLFSTTLAVTGLVASAYAHADYAPRGTSCPSLAHQPQAETRETFSGYKHNNLIARRDLEKRCGAQLAGQRLKRRSAKRTLGLEKRASTDSTDSVCTMTPEVTQGPYHILVRHMILLQTVDCLLTSFTQGELIRQNITENQAGVPLEVQINVIELATCEPVQVWIDAWHAVRSFPRPECPRPFLELNLPSRSCLQNATGYYSGFVAETGAALVTGSSGNSTSTGGGVDGNATLSSISTTSGNMTGGSAPTSYSGSTNTSDYTALCKLRQIVTLAIELTPLRSRS